jgi:delta8-fatty-acid desaturase
MGPWTNRTPPIRGGVFQAGIQLEKVSDVPDIQRLDPDKEFLDEGYGSGISRVASRDQSHRSSPSPEPEVATGSQVIPSERAVPRSRAGHLPHDFAAGKKPHDSSQVAESQLALNPEEWTEWAIQEGKVKDSRNFPSLDSDVQGDIATKYRLLHRRVQEEGLYSCPYIEYGKEMARYTTLFGLFLYTLSHGWYMTSAVFLGLFWVSQLSLISPFSPHAC